MRVDWTKLPIGTVHGYCRGSTDEQEDTLQAQEGECKSEYERNWNHLGYHWGGCYADRGVSGVTPFLERKAGYRLCVQLAPGDVVLMRHLDRGFRSVSDCVTMMHGWDSAGVRLVLLQMKVDTGTPAGRAVMGFLAVIAQWEREMIAERTRITVESRRKRSLPVGGAHPPYGFRRVGDPGQRRYVPWPEQRALGAQIVAWMDGGWTIDQVYEHLVLNGVNNPNTGEEISRTAAWRYYHWEQELRVEELKNGGPLATPPVRVRK